MSLSTAIVALLALPAFAASDYFVVDSTQIGGPAYNFENITGTGTAVVLGDDQVSAAVPIGFTFRYFGIDYTDVFIGSNGFLTVLANETQGCCAGQPIPQTDGPPCGMFCGSDPDGLIAGLWEDLFPPGGTIHYETLGVAPTRRFIVQFTSVPHYSAGPLVTFQFKLFESNNSIEVHYAAIPGDGDGAPSTAGIENQDGTKGVQYFHTDTTLTLVPVTPFAVKYVPVAPDYTVDDSNEVGGPTYAFEDISGTGTAVVLADDQVSGAVPVGFTFRYFRTNYTNIYISSNGFLTILPGQSDGCCTGSTIPTPGPGGPAGPDGVIAGVWVDLLPPAGGSITYQTLGSAPDRRFIVQFTTIQHYNGGAGGFPVTFQFKLFERTNVIEVHYATDAAPGAPYTRSAGIENHDGTRGVQEYLGLGPFVTPVAVRYIPVCSTPSPDLGNYYCSAIGYDFTDISGSGTPVPLPDDAVSGAIPIGFPFNYYGVDYNDLYISSNGFLTVLPGQYHGCCSGSPQPTVGTPDGIIAAWWADLYPPLGGGIRYQTLGVSPARIFVVQFTDVSYCCGPPQPRVTFEFKLFERSNTVEVHYATIPGDSFPVHSAAGIEDQAGTIGLQHTFVITGIVTPAAVRYTPGTQPVYMRSTVGPPWGVATNEDAMDLVFGGGNWDDLRYETPPPDLLNPNRTFVYMEGSDSNADELEGFLAANQASIEAWVADGRCLFINAAPNEGDGMSYGFGGVTLTHPDYSGNGGAVNPGYAIFNVPFTPIAAAYTGNFFGHGTISGGGVASLINTENVTSSLAEKGWGVRVGATPTSLSESGFAGFGGMTTDNFHAPQPQAHNLRANTIHYVSHHNCEPTPPYCGNGILEAYEACDDGNNVGGDGCSPNCRVQCPGTVPTVFATFSNPNITLSWTPSCEATDNDYEVYEGTSFYNHYPVPSSLCTTGGGTSLTFIPAPATFTYYLVVPRNLYREGSYGKDSLGNQRPQGTPACLDQCISCPP